MLHPQASWPSSAEFARLVSDAQATTDQGSPGAVDALLAAVRPALVAFFAGHLPRDTAEDLTQIALFRIAHALPWIDAERADRFVATIARNLLRTAWRRRAREERRSAPVMMADLSDAVERITLADVHAEYEDLARTVHRVAAASLPEPLHAVVLGLLRGESSAEIAERLHISTVTVRTRLMRARVILRQALGPYLDLPVHDRRHRAG